MCRRSAAGSRAGTRSTVTGWKAEPVGSRRRPQRRALREDTIRRIEQAAGGLATQSVARMDDELPWFRELPSAQRSWVMLVAQAGIQSYVDWLRAPDDAVRLTGEVFAAAPSAMARWVSLQQTVELVRTTIAVVEENMPRLAEGDDGEIALEGLLRFSREIAFAAAGVYASAAEHRGSWDQRLEALVIDKLVSGSLVGDPLPSQFAALGWGGVGAVAAVVGTAPDERPDVALTAVHTRAARLELATMAGVHGDRLVVIVGGVSGPIAAATALLPVFGAGPVVVGPEGHDPAEAGRVTRAALSGLRAVRAWPGAPRPVSAEALLPERALAGDPDARAQLVADVYRPLVDAGDVLAETATAYLDAGGALEATARALFVHANTVRYRLRRVADVCGEVPTDPRGALTLRVALILGRLES